MVSRCVPLGFLFCRLITKSLWAASSSSSSYHPPRRSCPSCPHRDSQRQRYPRIPLSSRPVHRRSAAGAAGVAGTGRDTCRGSPSLVTVLAAACSSLWSVTSKGCYLGGEVRRIRSGLPVHILGHKAEHTCSVACHTAAAELRTRCRP